MSASQRASEPGSADAGAASAGEPANIAATLAAWREAGKDRFDPIAFRFIEALAARTSTHTGALRQNLDDKLAVAMVAYARRRDEAIGECARIGERLQQRHPDAGVDIDRHIAAADLRGLHRLATRLEAHRDELPLAELRRLIDREPTTPAATGAAARAEPPGELKAVANGKKAWTRLSVDRQLSRSLARAPDNPGPFNSHRLVLRALQTMQTASPAYLQHFISYAETLLWLDQASFGAAADTAKAATRRDNDRKRRR